MDQSVAIDHPLKVLEEFQGEFLGAFLEWAKTIAGLQRSRHFGRWKIWKQLELAAVAHTLVRLRRLLAS